MPIPRGGQLLSGQFARLVNLSLIFFLLPYDFSLSLFSNSLLFFHTFILSFKILRFIFFLPTYLVQIARFLLDRPRTLRWSYFRTPSLPGLSACASSALLFAPTSVQITKKRTAAFNRWLSAFSHRVLKLPDDYTVSYALGILVLIGN